MNRKGLERAEARVEELLRRIDEALVEKHTYHQRWSALRFLHLQTNSPLLFRRLRSYDDSKEAAEDIARVAWYLIEECLLEEISYERHTQQLRKDFTALFHEFAAILKQLKGQRVFSLLRIKLALAEIEIKAAIKSKKKAATRLSQALDRSFLTFLKTGSITGLFQQELEKSRLSPTEKEEITTLLSSQTQK